MRLTASLLLTLSCACAYAQVPMLPSYLQPDTLLAKPLPAEDLAQKLDAILDDTAPRPFSGAVLVTQGGREVYLRVLGQQRSPDGNHPQADGQFMVGSITKQMTAALVLRLAQAGRIDLNLPVRTYMPELERDWAHEVTVAQLLNHTAGVDGEDEPLRFAAGSRFAYGNHGYNLLGKLAERVAGKPYAEQAEAMFGLCGMRDTAIAPAEPVSELRRRYARLVDGYEERADGSVRPSLRARPRDSAPSGGALSTLRDLAKWNDCLHQGKLVEGRAYAAMTSAAPNAWRDHAWGRLGYGYGLQLAPAGEVPEYSHGGYVDGYQSLLLYYPRDRVSVVILENTAWSGAGPANAQRPFVPHQRIRDLVRGYLAGGTFNWRGAPPR